MSENSKKKEQAPELFYIGKDGKRHDDGLHDVMLNDKSAHAAFQHHVMQAARARGMSESDVQLLYGNFQKK